MKFAKTLALAGALYGASLSPQLAYSKDKLNDFNESLSNLKKTYSKFVHDEQIESIFQDILDSMNFTKKRTYLGSKDFGNGVSLLSRLTKNSEKDVAITLVAKLGEEEIVFEISDKGKLSRFDSGDLIEGFYGGMDINFSFSENDEASNYLADAILKSAYVVAGEKIMEDVTSKLNHRNVISAPKKK